MDEVFRSARRDLSDFSGTGFARQIETPFDPLGMFWNGEAGFIFDPADRSSLRQNVDGTGAVVNDGDPVGWMIDQTNRHVALRNTDDTRRATWRTDGTLSWLEFAGGQDYDVQNAGAITRNKPMSTVIAGVRADATAAIRYYLTVRDGDNNDLRLGSRINTSHQISNCGLRLDSESGSCQALVGISFSNTDLVQAIGFSPTNDLLLSYFATATRSIALGHNTNGLYTSSGNFEDTDNSFVRIGNYLTSPFFGRIYWLAIRDAVMSDADMARAMRWVSSRRMGFNV